MKLLILPDCHAHPAYDNDRFVSLNRFIKKEKPDKIVCLGDFADLPSLCKHSSKKDLELQRYRADIDVTIDAQTKLLKGLDIPKIMLLGNHESRINTVVYEDPRLEGTLSMDDLQYKDFGWTVKRFLDPYVFRGIHFSHYFVSGVAGRPISGEHIAGNLCNKLHASSVVGHSHVFNHAERTRPDGKKIFGLSAGCFSHYKQIEGWNFATQKMWWHGVVLLEDVSDGYYDVIRAITMRKIMRDY